MVAASGRVGSGSSSGEVQVGLKNQAPQTPHGDRRQAPCGAGKVPSPELCPCELLAVVGNPYSLCGFVCVSVLAGFGVLLNVNTVFHFPDIKIFEHIYSSHFVFN